MVAKIVFFFIGHCLWDPQYLPLDEMHPVLPVNPYVAKLMVENILRDWAHNGRKTSLF